MKIIPTGITKFNDNLIWFLTTQETTYVIGVELSFKTVLNLYWGSRLVSFQDITLPVLLPNERSSQDPNITSAHEEFPAFGGLRYGPDVLRAKFNNGTRELDLVYASSQIKNQKLIITLKDTVHSSFQIDLHYTLDIENDLVIKTTVISGHDEIITKAQTAAFHVPPTSCKREWITLAGAWACETQVQTHSLKPGTTQTLESTRGIPSAQAYPYFAIKDQSTGEHHDCSVYFGTLGWSGSWKIDVHTDIEGHITITGGMNDRDFAYDLSKGNNTLELPAFVGGYSTRGLFGARQSLTNHIRDNKSEALIKDPHALAPVLYNGWEAYAFDVTVDNQKQMADKAAALGTEMFVLDDGWFHRRNSDNAGLGDWFADDKKFPLGLKPLADHVHGLGMKFGVWFEPEMVNPDSNLYREHPDWVYHYPDRTRHLERNQLVLDLSKPQVREYLLERIVSLVKQVGIDFIKWDMNRPISDAGSDHGEDVWRMHVVSFHELIQKVKQETDLIRVETCCSGGGRADLSILKSVESCWPSDNTRPDARLKIQYGASFIMPTNAMSCWVTDSPNDDSYQLFPISYRFHVSFMGTLGIGSDLNRLQPNQLEEYELWIGLYKKLRHVLQRGTLDWLVPPSDDVSSYTAVTQTSSASGDEAVVLAFRQTSPFWLPLHPIQLRNLVKLAVYLVTIWSTDPKNPVFTGTMSGAALMNKGIDLPYLNSKSYSSVVVHIKQRQ